MKIRINYKCITQRSSVDIPLDTILNTHGITKAKWDNMSDDDKWEICTKELEGLPVQPVWIYDGHSEIG